MNEPILCVAVLFFLGWIIYLKVEIGELKKDVEKMATRLKRYAREQGKAVELGEEEAAWGNKPKWMR